MRTLRLTTRTDTLVIEAGPDWSRVRIGALMMAGCTVLAPLSMGTVELGLVLGVCALATWWVVVALRRRVRLLVRAPGRLLLDAEVLELARVELRLRQWPLIKRADGYVLTLWAMTASGPEEVWLGRYPTLLDASRVSGQVEEFITRANMRQHRVS